ncbi:MAG: glycosyltransferase family 4 protein [Candidatus Latescibacterota bacterium]|nr:MAG: glycosyltransferase family 4 protein [Candidatus Latescibacterota bacterium]
MQDANAQPSAGAKRILVISPWASRWSLGGGAGVSDDYYFIDKFSKRGFEIHFLIPKSNTPSDSSFENVFVHTYPDVFGATQSWPTGLKRLTWPALFSSIVTVRALSVARDIKPDLILGHSHNSSFPAFVARELLRLPTCVKLFGVMDLVHWEWPRWKYYFKNFEQIIALKMPHDIWIILDDGTKGRDAALRHGVPSEKIRFLPNGINLEWMKIAYEKERIREELGIPPEVVVVLFLARLVGLKRPEMLLNAVPRVKQLTEKRLLFLFVGDGPSREGCERLTRSLEIETDVRFTGAIPHDKVPQIMSASDIFVSTSNFTNVAIPTCEAMVCGLPVVAFDVGNTRDLIHHGENGLGVEDGNVFGLAEAVARLATDESARREMAEHAKLLAGEKLTGWNERTDMELEIIRELIERHGDPALS